MANQVYIIVANTIVETGMLGHRFMFDSKAPFLQFSHLADHYGYIALSEKFADCADSRNPNRRWNVHMIKSEQGKVWGSEFDECSEGALAALLGQIPNGVLLVDLKSWLLVESALNVAGIMYSSYKYNGKLETA